jgi:REP element-mobilizing transposase RayT
MIWLSYHIIAVEYFKNFLNSNRKMSELVKIKLTQHSYYVGTAGQVSVETIKRYIEECQNL